MIVRYYALPTPRVQIMASMVSPAFAARLLAGLEVALSAALHEANAGRCLRCGFECDGFRACETDRDPWRAVHCELCGGILEPLERAEGEGKP